MFLILYKVTILIIILKLKKNVKVYMLKKKTLVLKDL